MVKSKLSRRSGSVPLRQFNPIHKKGIKNFLALNLIFHEWKPEIFHLICLRFEG